MGKYLNKETEQSLEELISYIKSSDNFIECMRLKDEIRKDIELTKLIKEVKSCQRSYVLSNYSKDKKKIYDEKLEELNSNNLFVLYNYHLDKVNEMLSIVKDELNDYFYGVTNILN